MADLSEPMVKNENRYYVDIKGDVFHIPDEIPAVYHVRSDELDLLAGNDSVLPGSIACVYVNSIDDGKYVSIMVLDPMLEWFEIDRKYAPQSDFNGGGLQ